MSTLNLNIITTCGCNSQHVVFCLAKNSLCSQQLTYMWLHFSLVCSLTIFYGSKQLVQIILSVLTSAPSIETGSSLSANCTNIFQYFAGGTFWLFRLVACLKIRASVAVSRQVCSQSVIGHRSFQHTRFKCTKVPIPSVILFSFQIRVCACWGTHVVPLTGQFCNVLW